MGCESVPQDQDSLPLSQSERLGPGAGGWGRSLSISRLPRHRTATDYKDALSTGRTWKRDPGPALGILNSHFLLGELHYSSHPLQSPFTPLSIHTLLSWDPGTFVSVSISVLPQTTPDAGRKEETVARAG